jgi:serine/threonine protein phosphatase 1
MVTRRLPDAGDGPSRVYAVGDVHGHSAKLAAMHDAIRRDLAADPTSRPMLIHLGDYIDRGPHSAGCLALIGGPPALAGVPKLNLMGNHERMLLDALDTPSLGNVLLWRQNGGAATLESWGIALDTPAEGWAALIPPEQLRLLQGLALHHRVGPYLFVHAGVRPRVPLTEQRPHDLVWIRETFLLWEGEMLPEAPGTVVVHGHTPLEAPEVRANRIGVDTNAGRGGPLTCAVLGGETPRFIMV